MNGFAVMTEDQFRRMFPKASKSFASANPQLVAVQPTPSDAVQGNVARSSTSRRGVMNRTETEFSFMLEAQKRAGDILRWEFEAITLRFASVRYTPDFCVWPPAIAVSGQVKFVEVKGPYIKGKFERAIERFRHARTYFPEFIFELWQKTRAEGWKRLI